MIQVLIIGVAAAILFFAQREIYRAFWQKNLRVYIQFDTSELYEGEYGNLQEVVINQKKLPLPMLKVKFMTSRNLKFENTTGNQNTDNYYRNDVFKISGGEKITRSLAFKAMKRGVYTLNSYEMVGTDLFLSIQLVSAYETYSSMYVLPAPYESADFTLSLQWLNGEILSKRHLLEDPFEYRGIREYQPYDSMRTINWKATAKTGELKVNQKDYTSVKVIRVFLNVDDIGVYKRTKCIEASINVAAGLVHYFLQQGIETAFYCNGVDCESGDITIIEKASGVQHERDILRAMARINLNRENIRFGEAFSEIISRSEGSMCDCIVSVNLYEDLLDIMSNYGSGMGGEYTWFCPTDEPEERYDQPGVNIPTDIRARRRIIRLWY